MWCFSELQASIGFCRHHKTMVLARAGILTPSGVLKFLKEDRWGGAGAPTAKPGSDNIVVAEAAHTGWRASKTRK